MSNEIATIGVLKRVAAVFLAAIILATAPLSAALAAAPKAGKPAASANSEATPEKIQELMTLLADPKVRDWLEKESKAEAAQGRESDGEANSISHEFDTHVAAIREHIVAVGAAFPDLPNQLETAHSLVSSELGDGGRAKGLLLLAAFVGLGFGVEWLFRRATDKIRRHLDEHPLETVNDRLRVVATRFAFACRARGSLCPRQRRPFLAFDWPPLLREMLFGYLVVFLVTRVAIVVGHLLLAPHHERFRVIPVETVAAHFWCRSARRLCRPVRLWLGGGRAAYHSRALRWRAASSLPMSLALGSLPLRSKQFGAARSRWLTPEALPHARHRLGRGAQNALLSIGIVLLWVLWVLHAMASFWLVLVVITLPLANA